MGGLFFIAGKYRVDRFFADFKLAYTKFTRDFFRDLGAFWKRRDSRVNWVRFLRPDVIHSVNSHFYTVT